MISKTLEKAINKQINEELASAYIYLDFSTQAAEMGFDGAANWFMMQWQEELIHTMKLKDYVIDRDGSVKLFDIKKSAEKMDSLLAMFQESYKHECYISKCINELYGMARDENDYSTQSMLQWFINEQVEEESSVKQVVDQLKMIGDSGATMVLFDKELGGRTIGGSENQ